MCFLNCFMIMARLNLFIVFDAGRPVGFILLVLFFLYILYTLLHLLLDFIRSYLFIGLCFSCVFWFLFFFNAFGMHNKRTLCMREQKKNKKQATKQQTNGQKEELVSVESDTHYGISTIAPCITFRNNSIRGWKFMVFIGWNEGDSVRTDNRNVTYGLAIEKGYA